MRIGILGAESGWHVRDLQRAARALGHEAFAIDFRRIGANIHGPSGLSSFDRMMVRTMPPGSLEQVIFRMDVLQRLEAQGIPILNPPRAVEICVDKYLASARLAAAGLEVPSTAVCQNAEEALEVFDQLQRDVIVKPLFGSEGRGMAAVTGLDIAKETLRFFTLEFPDRVVGS